MVHKFKFGVHRFIYDSESGYTHAVDELGYKMLDYLELPMAKDCPSALRYDLAKYDSDAISAVYAEFRKLSDEGKLFAADVAFDAVEADGKGGALVEDSDAGVTVKSVPGADNEVVASVDELVARRSCRSRAGTEVFSRRSKALSTGSRSAGTVTRGISARSGFRGGLSASTSG